MAKPAEPVRDSAIVVTGISKQFRMYHERNQSLKAALMRGKRASYDEFWALRDVTFDIPRGSTFGLIGENGSGKSTLLKCIARILQPDEGHVVVNGSMAALLELGSGFHQELSGRENIFLNGSILGLRKSEIEAKFDDIVDFAGVRQFIDQPVKNYSSGMYVRLGFSVAINVDPEILLVDEVLAVGDANFQDKCMEKFADFRRAGKTVVLVSHAMGSMRTMCDQVAWLEHGTLTGVGKANEVVDSYVDETHEDRIEIAGGGSRWGSGEASITGVELLDASGAVVNRVRTNDELTIRMHFRTSAPIEKPVFGFAIETVAGVYAWAHNSRDGEWVPDVIDGVGSVDLHIPRITLQAGAFEVQAGISDYTTTHTYDFLTRACRFEVHMTTPHESGGILSLGGSWGNLVESSLDAPADVPVEVQP